MLIVFINMFPDGKPPNTAQPNQQVTFLCMFFIYSFFCHKFWSVCSTELFWKSCHYFCLSFSVFTSSLGHVWRCPMFLMNSSRVWSGLRDWRSFTAHQWGARFQLPKAQQHQSRKKLQFSSSLGGVWSLKFPPKNRFCLQITSWV